MLYHLLPQLTPYVGALNVTRYITFRTAAASLTALAIGLVLGPWFIRKVRDFQVGQIIRQEGPQSHRAKAGTPTMGGLLILTAALVPTLLWADLSNPYIWVAVLATALCGAVGFLDDYLKITRRSHHGLLPRYKMGGLVLVGIAVGIAVLMLAQRNPPLYNTRLIFPFFKDLIPELGRVLRALRGDRDHRRDQRRQFHRRPRWSGDLARSPYRPRRLRRWPTSPATRCWRTISTWCGFHRQES